MHTFPIRSTIVALLLAVASVSAQPFTLAVPIRAVARDAAKPGSITWLATEGGIFRSSVGAPEWRNVYVRPPGQVQPLVRFIHIDRENPQVIYLVSNLDSGGIWKSIDGGITWLQANTGLPPSGSIDVFIGLPSAPRTFYAKAGDQLYKTTDGAATWVARAVSFPRNLTALDVNRADPSQMFAGARNGVYRSGDEGVSWTLAQALSLNAQAAISSILIDPSDPKVIHLVARGPKDSGAGFYRSVNGGERFNAVVLPVDRSFILPARLVSDPTGRAVYAGADENGIIYYTTNKGQIWGQFVILGAGGTTVAIDPNDPKTILAGTGRGLFSTDDGARWDSKIGPALPTISLPVRPLDFVLPAGSRGALQFLLGVVETPQWTLPLSASAQGGEWLTLNGVVANTPATPLVTVDTRGLERGDYTGEVRVDSPFAANAPLRLPVRLTVALPRPLSRSHRISTISGNGLRGNFGDNQPATRASFGDLDSVAVDRDGNIYVSDPISHVVRRIGADGVITRYAGNGRRGDTGDTGQALLAQLDTPAGLALDAAGNLFIADSGNGRIRRVSPDGAITTFAKDIGPCRGIAVDSSGNLYVTIPAIHVILRVDAAGHVALYAGAPGIAGFRGEGGPPGAALFSGPLDVFVDSRDRLLVADSGNNRIRRVASGIVATIAGSGAYGYQGDVGDATKVALASPGSVAADTAGNVYIADAENHRIRVVTPEGAMQTLGGTGVRGFSGDNGPAVLAQMTGPQDLAVEPSGNLLSAESGTVRIRRLVPPAPPIVPEISAGPVNWADGSGRLAPGTVFRLSGVELAAATVSRPDAPWPLDLGGVEVTLNGTPLPLSRVSQDEIIGLIPFDAPLGAGSVRVIREEAASRDVTVTLESTAPALLPSGPGRALAANEGGAANSADQPAAPGSLLTVYFTGTGWTENPPVGGAASGEESRPLLPVLVQFGEVTLEPLLTRLTPGRAGIAEVQFKIPVNEAGDYPVAVRVGDVLSASALVSVSKAE